MPKKPKTTQEVLRGYTPKGQHPKPRVVEKDIDLGRLAPETAIVQKVELPVTLRLKLGSLLIHCEEMLSPTGHTFDQHAIRGIVQDPEVVAFRDECAKMGILPVKR